MNLWIYYFSKTKVINSYKNLKEIEIFHYNPKIIFSQLKIETLNENIFQALILIKTISETIKYAHEYSISIGSTLIRENIYFQKVKFSKL